MLLDRIREVITRSPEQMISFAEFMQMALYDPEAGYYSQHVAIGAQGDFVTAPEVSPLFAHALAQQYLEVRERIDAPTDILEFGAGNGTLAAQILHALDAEGALPQHYYILEVSAHLRAKQEAHIAALPEALQSRVVWLTALPEQPIRGMIIANEVLDAMPVHQVIYRDNAWRELTVVNAAEGFAWGERPLTQPLEQALESALPEDFYQVAEQPYQLELNLACAPWIKSVAESLESGLCLIIDYGFARDELYAPQRTMGTVMCHSQQRTHADPLSHVGMQDITAHVDFTAVAEAAHAAGMEVDGFSEQGHFLLSLGILDKANGYEDTQAVKLLTMPHEMGALFKVIGLSKGGSHFWRGFELNDKRGRL